MFGFGKKKTAKEILATQSGSLVPMEQVPDDVFAQKILGDGIAVLPTDGKVVSPVDGVISNVTDTLHAYGIASDDGLDILVHIGVNTVELKGEGFQALVKEGDHVKAGDPLAQVDLELVASKGYPLHTPIIITNMDEITDLHFEQGDIIAGETVVMTYHHA